jgi:hypothetical protein
MSDANFINHITIAGDESYSMTSHHQAFIQVYDNLVKHLAERSKHHDQETRITTYLFNNDARCVVYDKDVLRMPSIGEFYQPRGGTALIDAALLAVDDQKLIPQKYGQHAFLTFVLTDGEENRSRRTPAELTRAIESAPDNCTYAAFVPDQHAVYEAKRFGFPKDNISVWDTSSARGVEDAGEVMRTATDNFMEGRAHGVHGYGAGGGGGLFKLRDFKAADVQRAAVPLTRGSYYFRDVHEKCRIDEFVTGLGLPYIVGKHYYQFTKAETIQPQKAIAVELGGDVYTGPEARAILGLPNDHSVRVKPDQKAGCVIFVQSTSYNRNLVPGTRLLSVR